MSPSRVSVIEQWNRIEQRLKTKVLVGVKSGLLNGAKLVQQTAIQNAKTDRIKQNIEISSVGALNPTNPIYMISIGVRLKNAPEAGAFEYGSGIWRTRKGTPGKYPIRAKNAPMLAFMWYKNNPLYSYLKPDINPEKVAFQVVHHPGVQAVPYLRPALQKHRKELKNIIAKAVKAELKK